MAASKGYLKLCTAVVVGPGVRWQPKEGAYTGAQQGQGAVRKQCWWLLAKGRGRVQGRAAGSCWRLPQAADPTDPHGWQAERPMEAGGTRRQPGGNLRRTLVVVSSAQSCWVIKGGC